VISSLVLFSQNVRERDLTLFNSGDIPLELRSPQFPSGYEIRNPTGHQGPVWTIPPRTSRRWLIRDVSHPAAKRDGEAVQILWRAAANDEVLGVTSILRQKNDEAKAQSQYVIGIDFGTSGTSIRWRNGLVVGSHCRRDDARPLSGVPMRFPTLIFVALNPNGTEKKFFIGEEARRQSEKFSPDSKNGFLVEGLKTHLRSDKEPFADRWGEEYTIDRLLERYLQEIYRLIEQSIPEFGKRQIVPTFKCPLRSRKLGLCLPERDYLQAA